MCGGSSCGGLPSAGTIQPRCCPHGCFFRVITASNPEVRCGQNCGPPACGKAVENCVTPMDRVGFEPTMPLRAYRFSRPPHYQLPVSLLICQTESSASESLRPLRVSDRCRV